MAWLEAGGNRRRRAGLLAAAACCLAGTPAGAGNLLVNSSFEAGAGYRYAIGRWYVNGLPNGRLDAAVKVHGRVSFRLPFSTRAYSPDGPYGIELRAATPVRLEKGRRYSFSVHLKTDVPDAAAHLAISPLKPYEHRGKAIHREKIRLGRATTEQGFRYPWRRHATTFTAPETVEAYWSIQVESPRPGHLWVDALQLEAGGRATAYAPAHPVAFGLVDGALGHVHDPGKPVPFVLRAYNATARKRTHKVTLRVLDDRKRVVARRTVTLAVGPNQARDVPVALDVGRRGAFLAELTVDGRPGYRELQSFSVLPRPRPIRPDRSSFGAYLTPSEEAVRILARAGFHWAATLTSAEPVSVWYFVEARKGRYAWRDADVDLFRRHGFEIMFNLEGWAYPRWAGKLTKAERTKAFARYVEAIVGRYKGKVRYFTLTDEIHNKSTEKWMYGRTVEPSWRSPREYADWHAAAARAAKRANPGSRIVLNTVSSGNFGPDALLEILPPETVDVVAGNYYHAPEFVPGFRRAADKHGVETVWVPGIAVNTWPVYYRSYAGPRYDTADNLRKVVRSVIRSFANGARVFFHYTANYVGNTNVYSVFEHDSSLETGGAQFAALAWLVDGWRSARPVPVSGDGRAEAYRIDRNDGMAVFAVWSRKANPKQTLRLAHGVRDVEVRDRWGNVLDRAGAVAGGRLPLDGNIRFLLLPSDRAATLERALNAARLVLATPPARGIARQTGRYALEARTIGKGKWKRKQIRLWYDAGDEGWIELIRRDMRSGAPAVALDGDGLSMRFRDAWDGRAGNLQVGMLNLDLFWGGRFWRSMPGRGGLAWESGRIANDNLSGPWVKATPSSAPKTRGLAPTAYLIAGARGVNVAIETAPERPDPRKPIPGAWDLHVCCIGSTIRQLNVRRRIHPGAPSDRDIRVRVRATSGR